jgi:hypothetical protein
VLACISWSTSFASRVFSPVCRVSPALGMMSAVLRELEWHVSLLGDVGLSPQGADPNYMNAAGDLTLFWGVDGGVEIIKVLYEYGADLDARTPKDWTPLSYAKACGKYGLSYEKGIYPEDVLKYYGASEYGSGPPALGTRSPRESYDPEADNFSRMRGSYQNVPPAP